MRQMTPLLLVLALLGGACSGDDVATTTTDPEPNVVRSIVSIDSVEFLYLESYPVQIQAIVSGDLPTPCHEARWQLDDADPSAPVIEVWSEIDPEVMCAQVLEPFEVTASSEIAHARGRDENQASRLGDREHCSGDACRGLVATVNGDDDVERQ